MDGYIRVGDMLKTMQMRGGDKEPIPFALTFITCDLNKQTGGKRISYESAVLIGNGGGSSETRNPNHFNNYTRNICGAGTNQVRKIHPLLVETFNGKTVIL